MLSELRLDSRIDLNWEHDNGRVDLMNSSNSKSSSWIYAKILQQYLSTEAYSNDSQTHNSSDNGNEYRDEEEYSVNRSIDSILSPKSKELFRTLR